MQFDHIKKLENEIDRIKKTYMTNQQNFQENQDSDFDEINDIKTNISNKV